MDENLINMQKSQKIGEINNFITSLQIQRNNLQNYRSDLNASWSGEEMTYINAVIDQIENEINLIIRRCQEINYYLQ